MSSPPTTLGQYQIIREIARSNDIVYEAYDPLMNRRVAVKELMMPQGSTGPQQDDRINRFKREAQAAGTLNHPNIMTVYSFAEDGNRTFMAMEYLDGQTLRNEIDTKGSIPVERAVEIACAVLSGLDHAHSKGVIHRDIKPDNIQILSNNNVKITDFGIARLTFQPNLTMDGQVFGTPSYMSPEQVVGRDIDARSDLFSVGVMLYEMIAGKKPFGGDSVVTITYAIMNTEAEQPPKIPWAVWSVIERALSKSPGSRYASAEEMRKVLQEATHPSQQFQAPDPPLVAGYGASLHPYGGPPPPPVSAQNPYASPNQGPIQAPYNPYSAPGPAANPYAGQYTPPAATYPYNPFSSPAGGGAAPHTPGMVAPIYYPPPPRQPLVSPEVSQFLRKFALALLIVGTLAAVIVIGLQALLEMTARAGQVRDQIQQGRIAADKAEVARKEGKAAEAELDNGEAEKDDPHNPVYHESQGRLLLSSAQSLGDPRGQAELCLKSAEEFKAAYADQTGQAKTDAGLNYAYAALGAASYSLQAGDSDLTRRIRTELESARAYVRDNTTVSTQIQEMILKLSA